MKRVEKERDLFSIMEVLKAENEENSSKISALNEKCLFLEQNEEQMEKKVEELNEEVENMTTMAIGKILADQRNAQCEIQISKLQAKVSQLQSAKKSLEVFADEALQKKLDHQTKENEERKEHINSLMVDKASLEKQIETSNQGLKKIEKKLKTLNVARSQVFALLKKVAAEVMDKEGIDENCMNSEIGVEEMKLLLNNLEVIKLALKAKDSKINDLNQKLESLHNSFLEWIFAATIIIIAAVSLAYVAGLSYSFGKA